jgi:hypothetical protein
MEIIITVTWMRLQRRPPRPVMVVLKARAIRTMPKARLLRVMLEVVITGPSLRAGASRGLVLPSETPDYPAVKFCCQ